MRQKVTSRGTTPGSRRHRQALAVVVAALLVLIAAGPGESAGRTLTPITSDPLRSSTSGRSITDKLTSLVDTAPQGATIRLTNPRMNSAVADSLRRASVRGVSVRVVTDPGATTRGTIAGLRSVTSALGTDPQRSSFVRLCPRSCAQPGVSWSLMHAKTATFSYPDGQHVSMIASQDLYPEAGSFEWNNALVTTNTKVWSTLNWWFDGIVKGTGRTFSAGTDAGEVSLYLFPRPKDTGTNNFYTQALAPVRCSGGTRIDLMTFDWRSNMRPLVDKLGALRLLGCDVRVVLNSQRADSNIIKALQRQKIATRFSDNAAAGKKYLSHAKLLSVHGYYGSSWVASTWTGSANIALGSLRSYDDNFIRVKNDKSVYDSYRAQMNRVWAAGRHIPVARSSATLTRGKRSLTARLYATGEGVIGSKLWLQRRIRPRVWKTITSGRTDATGRITWRRRSVLPLRVVFTGATNLTAVNSPISWPARNS